jgi:hypothetical protein
MSLNALRNVADILDAMDEPSKNALEYLAGRIHKHRDEAMDAMRHIYGLDQHRAEKVGAGEGGAA